MENTSTLSPEFQEIKQKLIEQQYSPDDYNAIADFVVRESDFNRNISSKLVTSIIVSLFGMGAMAEVAKLVAQKMALHETQAGQITGKQKNIQDGAKNRVRITMK